MNKKQRLITIIGLIFMVFAVLHPPVGRPGTYGRTLMKGLQWLWEPSGLVVNISLLLVELLLIGVVVGTFYFMCRSDESLRG